MKKSYRPPLYALAALFILPGLWYGCLYLWSIPEPPPLRAQYALRDGPQTRSTKSGSFYYHGKIADGFWLGPEPGEYEFIDYGQRTISAPPGTRLRFAAAKPGRRGARLDTGIRTPAVDAKIVGCAEDSEPERIGYQLEPGAGGFTLAVPDRPPGLYILRFDVYFLRGGNAFYDFYLEIMEKPGGTR